MMGRSGFFRKCSRKWLFPSMQDAMRHAQYEPVLVSGTNDVWHGVCVYICYLQWNFVSSNTTYCVGIDNERAKRASSVMFMFN